MKWRVGGIHELDRFFECLEVEIRIQVQQEDRKRGGADEIDDTALDVDFGEKEQQIQRGCNNDRIAIRKELCVEAIDAEIYSKKTD